VTEQFFFFLLFFFTLYAIGMCNTKPSQVVADD